MRREQCTLQIQRGITSFQGIGARRLGKLDRFVSTPFLRGPLRCLKPNQTGYTTLFEVFCITENTLQCTVVRTRNAGLAPEGHCHGPRIEDWTPRDTVACIRPDVVQCGGQQVKGPPRRATELQGRGGAHHMLENAFRIAHFVS